MRGEEWKRATHACRKLLPRLLAVNSSTVSKSFFACFIDFHNHKHLHPRQFEALTARLYSLVFPLVGFNNFDAAGTFIQLFKVRLPNVWVVADVVPMLRGLVWVHMLMKGGPFDTNKADKATRCDGKKRKDGKENLVWKINNPPCFLFHRTAYRHSRNSTFFLTNFLEPNYSDALPKGQFQMSIIMS